MSEAITQARAEGARLGTACAAVGLTPRTCQRWHGGETLKADARRREHRPADRVYHPANRLAEPERDAVLAVANEPRFASASPHQSVAILADEGRYLASEATFYRLLRAADQVTPRGRKAPPRPRPQSWEATGPHPVWSWDITYLATTLREAVRATDRVLHSDNGSPMKGATLLATLQHLGVVPSFSRPAVSNDNPYSEAGFATLKGSPAFPEKPFADLSEARTWIAGFVAWYNETHRHSALKFVTPDQRHRGADRDLLAQRDALYQAAKAENPERWSGPTRNWEPPASVLLNPGKPRPRQDQTEDPSP